MGIGRNQLDALITLIDDPDETVYSQVKGKLMECGEEAIPTLEDAWERHTLGSGFQSRVEEIIHSIQFERTCEALRNWARTGGNDLLQGAMLVAKYRHPDLDEERITRFTEQLRKEVWLELNDELTSYEKVRVINHILFDVHGFRGNKKSFHATQNSCINNVLESKRGNPISLSIIYLAVAQHLGLPVFGVNLPGHFVLAYLDRQTGLPDRQAGKHARQAEPKVLFYINPFSRGMVFSRNDIERFLKRLRMGNLPRHYRPCSNITTIERAINHLALSCGKQGCPEKVGELKTLAGALRIIGKS